MKEDHQRLILSWLWGIKGLSLLNFALFCFLLLFFLKMSKHSSISRTDDVYVCSLDKEEATATGIFVHKNEDIVQKD